MELLVIILLVVAAVFFVAGFFHAGEPRWNVVSGGLFFTVVALIVERLG